MPTFFSKLTVSILCVLLIVLPLSSCGKVNELVAGLDSLSVAIGVAEAFLPANSPALPWLNAVATFADNAATELASTDTASVQLSKLIDAANAVLAQYVPNAAPKVAAVAAALKAIISIITNLQSGQGASPSALAYAKAVAPSKPLPLSSADKAKLAAIHKSLLPYLNRK
jgi:hypothetical protein